MCLPEKRTMRVCVCVCLRFWGRRIGEWQFQAIIIFFSPKTNKIINNNFSANANGIERIQKWPFIKLYVTFCAIELPFLTRHTN